MLNFPNCKINLGLSVLEKRPDGYHSLETVFYPLPLCDVLEIIPASDGKTEFFSTGLPIPGSADQNLCLKAYQLLKKDFDLEAVKIHLHKVIPTGAGLGGGSSDAAHTLLLLNELFGIKLTKSKLISYAKELGADCAFFIVNHPVVAYERGDKFKSLELDLSRYFVVLIKPEIHVSTTEAYEGVKPADRLFSIKELLKKPPDEWKYTLKNDFEESVFQKYPEIENIKNTLYQERAVYASMSGSGSALYGIFEKVVDLSTKFKNYFYWSSKI